MGTLLRLVASILLVATTGCSNKANVRVGMTDPSVPADAEWDELPEAVRARYFEMAAATGKPVEVDRPPYPAGGMAGLMGNVTYPESARRADIEGVVIVRAVIAADGSVAQVAVAESAHPLLDAEAVAAVERTRFVPAAKDGEPVAAEIHVPVRFALR